MANKFASPENVLRYTASFCLVAAVAVPILSGRDPGKKDLSLFFFDCIWVFLLFYVQYLAVLKVMKGRLNPRVGYAQVFTCLLLLLWGGVKLLNPSPEDAVAMASSDFLGQMLATIGILGEACFIFNVIWSYAFQQAAPATGVAKTPAAAPPKSALPSRWPSSPVKLFGYSAAFLAAGGLVLLALRPAAMSFMIPTSDGACSVHAGWGWLILAVPFALFAGLYALFGRLWGAEFHPSAKRIHFLLTLVAVGDALRVWITWQLHLGMRNPGYDTGPEILQVAALFAAAIAAFAVNIFLSHRRSARP